MHKPIQLLFLLIITFACRAQKEAAAISVQELERIETVLASDEMRGRRTGTPEIDKAAKFIADEFRKAGLEPLPGNKGYLQEFTMVRPRLKEINYQAEGMAIAAKDIVLVSSQEELKIDGASGYAIEYIRSGENLGQKAKAIISKGKNAIVYVDADEDMKKAFPGLSYLARQGFKTDHSVVFILMKEPPEEFMLKAEQEVSEVKFSNVVGVIPGKSKKDEYVVFSGHYDHIGIARNAVDGDSIYNGANDDASGITAVILLAQQFKKEMMNERTLVFSAFTAEEIGGFGSQYFSKQLDPEKVVAMFNIEMIGTPSKWGKNSAFITGFEKTSMGKILQENLEGSAFQFYPDPYPDQNLFYRSDNATLARLGVPAHTISTAKMENEPNYHKVSDEVETLDLENMAEIIKAIAISSRTIVSGKHTPSRLRPESLR